MDANLNFWRKATKANVGMKERIAKWQAETFTHTPIGLKHLGCTTELLQNREETIHFESVVIYRNRFGIAH